MKETPVQTLQKQIAVFDEVVTQIKNKIAEHEKNNVPHDLNKTIAELEAKRQEYVDAINILLLHTQSHTSG